MAGLGGHDSGNTLGARSASSLGGAAHPTEEEVGEVIDELVVDRCLRAHLERDHRANQHWNEQLPAFDFSTLHLAACHRLVDDPQQTLREHRLAGLEPVEDLRVALRLAPRCAVAGVSGHSPCLTVSLKE